MSREFCYSDTFDHTGEILCRIPDGTPEICEVGKLLREGKFQSSEFIIQEHLCERQCFCIPPRVVNDMIHDLHFRMPEVKIHVSQRCAQFNAMLHLDNKEEYSISGFPRSIVGKGAQTRSKLYLFRALLFRPSIN